MEQIGLNREATTGKIPSDVLSCFSTHINLQTLASALRIGRKQSNVSSDMCMKEIIDPNRSANVMEVVQL